MATGIKSKIIYKFVRGMDAKPVLIMEAEMHHVNDRKSMTMSVGFRLSDHVVEDGFSFEGVGHDEHTFRQYFKDLPHNLLHELLKHFNNRHEWEVCGIIRDLLHHSPRESSFY